MDSIDRNEKMKEKINVMLVQMSTHTHTHRKQVLNLSFLFFITIKVGECNELWNFYIAKISPMQKKQKQNIDYNL